MDSQPSWSCHMYLLLPPAHCYWVPHILVARVRRNCELVQWTIHGQSWHCEVCPFHREVSGGSRHAGCSHHCKHQFRYHENLLPVPNSCKLVHTWLCHPPLCITWPPYLTITQPPHDYVLTVTWQSYNPNSSFFGSSHYSSLVPRPFCVRFPHQIRNVICIS